MTNQKYLTDTAIRAVLTECLGLQSFSARRCPKIKGLGFAMVDDSGLKIEKYAKIKFLTLSGCDSLKDHSLQLIGKYFGKDLETLNVSACKLLTGKGLGKIAKYCSSVVSVDVGGTKITCATVLSFLKKCSGTLRSLNIGRGAEIDDGWIADVMGRDTHDCLIYRR
jgi:hypothetical protein